MQISTTHTCLRLEYHSTSLITTTAWIRAVSSSEEPLLKQLLPCASLLRSWLVPCSPAFRYWHFEAELGWVYLFCTLTSIPLSGMRSLQGNASGVMECWYTRAVKLPVVREVTRHALLTWWTTRMLNSYFSSRVFHRPRGLPALPFNKKFSWHLKQDLLSSTLAYSCFPALSQLDAPELINHNPVLPFPA